MTTALRLRIPAVLAGVSAAQAATTVAITAATNSWHHAVAGYLFAGTLWGLVFGLIGALVLREAPGNRLGILFAGMGGWMGMVALADPVSAAVPSGWLHGLSVWVQGMWTPTPYGVLLVPPLYPHGRPISPAWGRWVRVSITAAAISILALACSRHVVDGHPEVRNPIQLPVPDAVMVAVVLAGTLVAVAIAIAAMVAQARRTRHGGPGDRARAAWLFSAVLFMLAGVVIEIPAASLTVQLLAAGCLAAGIIRHRLFDIEAVLTRSLVYAVAVAASLAAALLAAAALGYGAGMGVLPALTAAATSLALARADSRMRQMANRLLFGGRDNPAQALGTLGERLAATPTPDDVLPAVVTTLRESLALPYAAVTLVGEQEPAAHDGAPVDRQVGFPLQYGGQEVGCLRLGLRRGERALSAAEERLVSTFAAQAGTAAHGAQVTRELRRSRERLVAAREEERRTLRRDLHDGVGPALAGMALGLQSLQRARVGAEQTRLAADLCEQAQQTLSEVRRLAQDLRPSTLDELGLESAVRQHAQMMTRLSGIEVEVSVPRPIPDLPAAVEVAAYRIVQEGLANVARHAGTRSCAVSLDHDGALLVCIRDDGRGEVPREAGAGLRSMRERAEELGGRCTVTFHPGRGTTVRAELPLALLAAIPDPADNVSA
jgi:two-component system, NarL family, sensor kinase